MEPDIGYRFEFRIWNARPDSYADNDGLMFEWDNPGRQNRVRNIGVPYNPVTQTTASYITPNPYVNRMATTGIYYAMVECEPVGEAPDYSVVVPFLYTAPGAPPEPPSMTVALWRPGAPLVTDIHDTAATVRYSCLLYTSPSPRDRQKSRMPSSA